MIVVRLPYPAGDGDTRAMALTITAIVCAYNEVTCLSACLHSLLAQTRPPDEIIVIDNASTDGTGDVARGVPGVTVVREPRKGLVMARETGRRAARGDVLDQLKDRVFRDLLTCMLADTHTIEPAIDLILIARHLERIGDHATNIAEDIIFIVEARDVRHHAGERS